MSSKAEELRAKLIRNIDEVPKSQDLREPHYDSMGARLAHGTAAQKMGVSVDVLQPGKRGCPYHLHHAQEEMFVVLEGEGTLRVAGELLGRRQADCRSRSRPPRGCGRPTWRWPARVRRRELEDVQHRVVDVDRA